MYARESLAWILLTASASSCYIAGYDIIHNHVDCFFDGEICGVLVNH